MFSGKIFATLIAATLAFQAAYAAPGRPAPDADPVPAAALDVPAAPIAGLEDLQPADSHLDSATGAELAQRANTDSGSFTLTWHAHLDHANDLVLQALVTYAQGKVFSAGGSGVRVSPFGSTGTDTAVFRVTYLSADSLWTAAARIYFNFALNKMISYVDEGVDQDGQSHRDYLDVTYKAG